MQDAIEATAVARARADKIIDKAVGELRASALKIGEKCGIPEGVAGHSIDELLGRMAYVPTMARDLRRACGQELAKAELERVFGEMARSGKVTKASKATTPAIDPSKIPDSVPVSLDIGQLDGVTSQTIKALRAAGLNTVGDIVVVPDEHLIKFQGLGEKSIAQVRLAIAKATARAGE